MESDFVDHFGAVAAPYAECRPSYPAALFDQLASLAPGRRLAWDCATGTGQAARDLAGHFSQVVATDASAAQIAQAVGPANVSFRVASAEDAPLDSHSVDLVTVAQALHWFQRDAFYATCERVLVPGGLLAVWTYGPARITAPGPDAVLQRYNREIVAADWPPERALVDSGYGTIRLPYPEIPVPQYQLERHWTRAEVLGYLGTWSATTAHRHRTGIDPREQITAELEQAWPEPQRRHRLTWPLTLRVCRKGEGDPS